MSIDPAIEQLEDELRASRVKPWDVETFLANRHQTKIDALTAPDDAWKRGRQVASDILAKIAEIVGYATMATLAGLWLLSL